MSYDRQARILKLLDQKGDVHLQQLKDVFPKVSLMTLRRDLISLENEGRLVRTHGGAVSMKRFVLNQGEEDSYSLRAAENVDSKIKIAEKAVLLVEKGRSIYFDAGSTIMCLAKELPDDNYSILTSGLNIALEIVKKQKASVVALGGFLNKNTLSVSGPDATESIENINIDIAFMSASGFSLSGGFTVSNIYECELKKKIVRKAKRLIMLMDSAKINKSMAFTFAGLKDIDVWVAENELPPDVRAEALANGVELI